MARSKPVRQCLSEKAWSELDLRCLAHEIYVWSIHKGFSDCKDCDGDGEDWHEVDEAGEAIQGKCHSCKGSGICKRDPLQSMMLVISELSEATEHFRNGNHDQPLHALYEVDGKPDGFAFEIVDAIIRLLNMAGELGIDVKQGIPKKMAYNETRPYRHGGKKA
jgi:hypothetical protein